MSCQRRSLRSFAASVDLESIPQLHCKLRCPSATGLKCFIRDAQQHAPTVDQIAEIDRLVCSLCSHHGPAPARLMVALPNYRQPGLCVHIDMGSFSFPITKSQLKAAVVVDAFSMLIMGDLYPPDGERQGKNDREGKMRTCTSNSVDTAHIYIQRAEGIYSTLVTDMGPEFDSNLFRTFICRLGSECKVVPREAH